MTSANHDGSGGGNRGDNRERDSVLQNRNRPLLEFRNLQVSASYRDDSGTLRHAEIVRGASFTLQAGRALGLIGESGAGKSTVGLAALAYGRGGCAPSGGEVLLEGANILALDDAGKRALRGAKVAYVAQSAAAAFNPAHRLEEQLLELPLARGLTTRREGRERMIGLFRQLGLPDPENFGARFPHQVSGGQLQRAMTAMALMGRPLAVVFDEPTTALDVTTQADVLAAIKKVIREENTAAIYISHDLAVVAQVADDILVLRNGEMIEHAPTAEMLKNPREEYTRELLAARATAKPESPPDESDAPLLEARKVSAAYRGGGLVLREVSASLSAGRTLAVVGESGSGKSTLARTITGLLPPQSGEVLFEGKVLPPRLSDRDGDTLRRIQMIHQHPDTALNPRQRASDIVGRPLDLWERPGRKERRERLRELMAQVELDAALLERFPPELSGGQKQRLCVARALAARPSLMVCDEPTSALDPLVAAGVLRLLLRLQSESGAAYLFITHDISVVRAMADSVVVMRDGEVARFGPKSEALSPPYDDYTALLLSSVPEMRPGWLEEALAERRMQSAGH